jgi:hypothetical protein
MSSYLRDTTLAPVGSHETALLHLVIGPLTILVCASGAGASQTNAPGCDAMVGIWEYAEPPAPGHAITAKQGAKYLGITLHTRPEPYSEQTKPRTATGARQTHTP